ncbi:MAG: hypothetical protein HRU06_01530 [Oceanospirillaceae bacterium]|nr:hypothetical protein [Oceanospirillaceae bacterium]
MNKSLIKISMLVMVSTLVACGGSGVDSADTSGESGGVAIVTQTGQFIDSAVGGVSYKTATQSGTTNSSGDFEYVEGEEVTFSLGDIELGTARAGEKVTPYDLGDADHAIKVARFLMTLDADQNPLNGLDLSGIDVENALGQSLSGAIDQALIDLLIGQVGAHTLVDIATATDHLKSFAQETFSIVDGRLLLKAELSDAEIAEGKGVVSVKYGRKEDSFKDLISVSAKIQFSEMSDYAEGRSRLIIIADSADYQMAVGIGLEVTSIDSNNAIVANKFLEICSKIEDGGCEDETPISIETGFGSGLVLGTEYAVSARIALDVEYGEILILTVDGKSIVYSLSFIELEDADITHIFSETKFLGGSAGYIHATVDDIIAIGIVKVAEGNYQEAPYFTEDFSSGTFANDQINFIKRTTEAAGSDK